MSTVLCYAHEVHCAAHQLLAYFVVCCLGKWPGSGPWHLLLPQASAADAIRVYVDVTLSLPEGHTSPLAALHASICCCLQFMTFAYFFTTNLLYYHDGRRWRTRDLDKLCEWLHGMCVGCGRGTIREGCQWVV